MKKPIITISPIKPAHPIPATIGGKCWIIEAAIHTIHGETVTDKTGWRFYAWTAAEAVTRYAAHVGSVPESVTVRRA